MKVKNERFFRVYPEIRNHVVKLLDAGHSVSIISDKLGVPEATLYQWRLITSNQQMLRNSSAYKEEHERIMAVIEHFNRKSVPEKARRGRPPSKKKTL